MPAQSGNTKTMHLQVGVKIALLNNEGAILLLKRNANKYPGIKNLWDLAGGRIQPGVGLHESLEREVREETGMQLASNPRLLGAQDILLNDKHVVRITYVGRAHGTVSLSEEHESYGWFKLPQIEALEGLDTYFSTLLSEKHSELIAVVP